MLQYNRQGLCHLCHCHLANWHIDIHLLLRPEVTIVHFQGENMSFFFLQNWVTVHQSHPAWVIKQQMIFRCSLSNPHPCRYIAHWRLKGMTSPKNTYSFGHLHCFNSTMYAYCLLGRPKNDRPFKSYDQISYLAWSAHWNYNVKHQIGGLNRFMGL